MDWSEEGVEGSFKFLKRYFKYTVNHNEHPISSENHAELNKHLHKVIKKMTEDIENFQFNTAISQLMELLNTISKIGTNEETAIAMATLIAPFAPFIAESIWEHLNQSGSVHEQSWPTYDPSLVVDNEITMVIQVNGKVRDKINTPRNYNKDDITQQALSQNNVKKYTDNKEIIKTIIVPERLINFVVK